MLFGKKRETRGKKTKKTKNKISTIPKCISNNKLFAYFSKSILINFKGCYKSKKINLILNLHKKKFDV